MPKIKRGKKAPPEGWELIEPTLIELGKKMREGTSDHQQCKPGPKQYHTIPSRE